jgi:hypothetical protein
MTQRRFNEAAKDVLSGGIGGILSYQSVQASGIPATSGMTIAAFLMVTLVALFYWGLDGAEEVGTDIYDRLNGGQTERKRNQWPEGRAS